MGGRFRHGLDGRGQVSAGFPLFFSYVPGVGAEGASDTASADFGKHDDFVFLRDDAVSRIFALCFRRGKAGRIFPISKYIRLVFIGMFVGFNLPDSSGTCGLDASRPHARRPGRDLPEWEPDGHGPGRGHVFSALPF